MSRTTILQKVQNIPYVEGNNNYWSKAKAFSEPTIESITRVISSHIVAHPEVSPVEQEDNQTIGVRKEVLPTRIIGRPLGT